MSERAEGREGGRGRESRVRPLQEVVDLFMRFPKLCG